MTTAMSKSTPRLLTSLAALSCIGTLICWSSAPLFIKYLTGYLDLWTQNLLRYVAACLFWLPFLLIAAKTGQLPRAVWKRALLPFIPNIIMQNLWAAAFYYIDPGFASLLSTTAFLWVIILSVIFFADERRLSASRLFRLSIVLSIVGPDGGYVLSSRLYALIYYYRHRDNHCSTALYGGFTRSR